MHIRYAIYIYRIDHFSAAPRSAFRRHTNYKFPTWLQVVLYTYNRAKQESLFHEIDCSAYALLHP